MPNLLALILSSLWLRVGLTLLLAVIGGRWLGRTIRVYGARLAARTDSFSDDYFVNVIGYSVEWATYLMGVLAALATLHVDVTPFLTGAGFAGIILGLAAREYLANVVGGVIIIVDKPFEVGDRILLPKELGDFYGTWGDVVSIGLRSTKILSVDGVILTVPNGLLVNEVVVNFSHALSPNLRARVQIGVHPEPLNTQNGLALLREIVASHPLVRDRPRPPQVLIRDLRQHEATLEARFYIEEPWQLRPVRSDIFEQFIVQAPARNIRLSAGVQRVYLEPNSAAPVDGPPRGVAVTERDAPSREDDGDIG